MAVTDLIFQVGNITFTDPFEMPNGIDEGLSDLGGNQKMVVNEFAGGIISAQLMGLFPTKLDWTGKIFGATAHDRARQLDGLRGQGLVNLQYGQWNFSGVVKTFTITAKYQFEVHYKCCFIPIQDNNQMAQNGQQNPATPQSTLSQAQQVAQFQVQTPVAPYTFSPTISNGVAQLNNSLNQTLQKYSGDLLSFQPADIASLQNQIATLQNQLNLLIGGTDVNAASAAGDLSTSLNTINVALSRGNGTPIIIPAVNPNLYALASIYYGDPSQWQVIANANSLTDPFPIGSYQLIIPNNLEVVQTQPPTII